MKYTRSATFLIAVLFLTNFAAYAQESGEAKVVDEVVAQVNDGVVTLSRIKREMKATAESYVAENKKTPEQAQAEVEAKQGELIANIINEELLLQKGKELNVDSDVQGQINQRFLGLMKQYNLKTLDALYKEMEKAGVNPDDLREVWRKQFTRDAVFQREVDSRVYSNFTSKDIKAYYEANKAKFTKPETISISEIFLGFAGRSEAAVREKAAKIVAQARGGADFAKLAEENSDRPDVKTTKGKAGTFNIKDMDERFVKPLQNVKAGGVTEPIEIEEGLEILHVDAKTQSSSESYFDENEARRMMTYEKLPDERKKYLTKLREESYIKINDAYRPLVAPILFADDRKAEAKKPAK